MKSLVLQNLQEKHAHENIALISVSENGIIKRVTFATVFNNASKIKLFMLKNIADSNVCIGLYMDKNEFLPSVIISLQDLDYSFVVLSTKTLLHTVDRLNIKYLFILDSKPPSDNFHLEDILQLSDREELQLWVNTKLAEKVDYQSYKDIFCVVQTSGSTGESKHIFVPHDCIEKNVASLNKYFDVTCKDVIYWGTPLTFDPTLVELILGILCQATLVIVPKLVALNPTLLYQALFRISSITFLQVVPSVFLRWSKQQICEILLNSSLETLAFGGEPFPKEILKYKRKGTLKLFNLYGVTELSCWATIADLTLHSYLQNEVSLGEALDETFIQIKNYHEEVISDGIGEIYIGSSTRYCYINNRTTLSTRFVVPTGDLGEWMEGTLFYRGRKTRVVKRFGHRLVLPKIESTIFSELGLQNRLVYSVHLKKLLAFIIIEEHFHAHSKIRLLDKLRVKLLKILPENSIPDFLEVLSHFPLNGHGKICDKSLERFYKEKLNDTDFKLQSPGGIFIDVVSDYLKTDLRESSSFKQLGKYSFFELGGNSILAIQVLQTFQEKSGNDSLENLVTLLINDSIQKCLDYVVQNVNFKRRLLEDINSKVTKVIKHETEYQDCVIWKYDLKGCVDAAPLVFQISGKTYIAAGGFAHIFGIVCQNGEEWLTLTLPQEIEAQPSISRCGNFVFIGCANGNMYSINVLDKKIVWEYHSSQKIKTSACVCRRSDVVFGSYDGFVYCLAIQDGSLLWKTELLGSIRADPVYCEDFNTIYIGTIKGMCYALNYENGNVIWTCKLESPVFGAPCVVSGCTVWASVTGKLSCISMTGDVKWTHQVDGNVFSSLIPKDDKIYFASHDTYLYKLVLTDTDYEISKFFKLESECSSSPFLYQDMENVFVISICNAGILYVIDESSKIVRYRIQLPAQSFSSPYVFKNRIYVGCRDNNLYCIDIEKMLIN